MGGEGVALWPIAASPAPILAKQKLKVCARAFTQLLQYLVTEIPMSFLRLSFSALARWFRWCGLVGMTAIAELDFKEQFNNIPPDTPVP